MKNNRTLLALLCSLFIFSCYKEDDYLPSNIDYTKFLTLSASDTTVFADGESMVVITGELPLEIRDDKSSIVFTTTKGTFDNGTKTITKSATIQSVNGINKRIAKIKLTSTTKIEKALVEATVGDNTKSVEISFVTIDYNSLLTITQSATTILADGQASSTITVEQPINTKDEFIAIGFTTTKGTFENGQKAVTKNSVVTLDVTGVYKRKATVNLISSKKIETATVEIAIKNSNKTISINFVNAYPDSIRLSTSAIAISQGFANSITLTTSLLRFIGTPSQGNIAEIQALDTNNNKIGSFINYSNVSDENGSIVNKFTLGDVNYHGAIKILTLSKNANNKEIKDSIKIVSP